MEPFNAPNPSGILWSRALDPTPSVSSDVFSDRFLFLAQLKDVSMEFKFDTLEEKSSVFRGELDVDESIGKSEDGIGDVEDRSGSESRSSKGSINGTERAGFGLVGASVKVDAIAASSERRTCS